MLGPFSKQDHVQITTLGLEFATSEILGAWLGFAMDQRYNSSPIFLIVGVAFGFALGMYIIVRSAKQLAKSPNKEKAEKKDGCC